jgi:hypothetical protein
MAVPGDRRGYAGVPLGASGYRPRRAKRESKDSKPFESHTAFPSGHFQVP